MIRLAYRLPNNPTAKIIGNQLMRSSTSVGANYRLSCESRSKSEFVSRIKSDIFKNVKSKIVK